MTRQVEIGSLVKGNFGWNTYRVTEIERLTQHTCLRGKLLRPDVTWSEDTLFIGWNWELVKLNVKI